MWFNPREMRQQDAIPCKSSEYCKSTSAESPTLAKLARFAAPPLLKSEERDLILDWLKAIGEINAETITSVVRRCDEDLAVRDYFLGMAKEHKMNN